MNPFASRLTVFLCAAALLAASPVRAGRVQDTIARAEHALESGDAATGAALYRELAAQSPRNGAYWAGLGRAELKLDHVDAAMEAYRKAAALGYEVAEDERWLASLEAGRGNGDEAVRWYEQALEHHLTNGEITLMEDEALGRLAQDPKFSARLFPKLPDDASRLQKWQADLAFFERRVPVSHWALFEQTTWMDWQRGIDRLKTDAARLSDWEMNIRLNEIMRQGRSGHSWVLPVFDAPDLFHIARIQIAAYPEGWYVRAAVPELGALVGKRIVRMGPLAPEQALEAMTPSIPHDSDTGLRVVGALLMTIPEYAKFYGFGAYRDSLQLTLAGDDGKERSVVVPAPPMTGEMIREVFRANGTPAGWVDAAGEGGPGNADAAPISMRHRDQWYWMEPLAADSLLYFQFNGVRDADEESLAGFAARIETALESPALGGLVIDVRSNGGGNGDLLEPLLAALTASPKLRDPGHLYVLTSGRTFSAASNFIAAVERRLPATFVGELSGSGPTHIGEDNVILLPNSGTKVMAATRQFVGSYSDDYRPGIAPHIAAPQLFRDFVAHRDSGMEAVLTDWRAR